ncbi:hypothetical protein ACFVSN_07375 [Kitasatospora sp. NPDC057904]|uniref:hypothetical protein n=1 Tax=unclassified Kitasatospora TaxID=2633591 RepID=UPI0036D85421
MRRGAQGAVKRLEAQRFRPGFLSDALGRYEQFLRRPGRWLYVVLEDCECHDVFGSRDDLQAMLDALPSAARRELSRIVARLDAEFERRTLPDPYASSWLTHHRSPSLPWWRRRLTVWWHET